MSRQSIVQSAGTIVAFLPNWVGDAVMATPALRAVRRQFAKRRLVAVARPVVGQTLEGLDWFDDVLAFDPRSANRDLRSWPMLRQLRAMRPELALLFTHSFRTALLARACGARERIGFARHGRGWLLSKRLAARRLRGRVVPAPVLDDYLAIAKAAGCAECSTTMELATSAVDEQAADGDWQRAGWRRDEPVVVLNSSGAYGAAKLWPSDYFAGLAFRVATQDRMKVLVLCGPSERAVARDIAATAAHRNVVSLADEALSIGLSKACVRRARLMVTTDSGPRHFAAAFGVDSITLFGPTHPAWSDTHDPRSVLLQHPVECGPCQRRQCPLGHHQCMRGLGVAEVYRAVTQVLSQPRPAVAA